MVPAMFQMLHKLETQCEGHCVDSEAYPPLTRGPGGDHEPVETARYAQVSFHPPLLLPGLISRDTPGLAVQNTGLQPGSRK